MPGPWSRTVTVPVGGDAHLDGAAVRPVLDGVVEQVVHGAAEALAVRLDDDGLRVERDLPPRRVAACPRDGLRDELVEAHVLALGGVRRLAVAGERDQVGDQQPELIRLGHHVVEDLAALGGRKVRLRAQHLGVRAHARHGRAQLVRGVRDEPALGLDGGVELRP